MAHDFNDLKEADVQRFQRLFDELLAMLKATTRQRGSSRSWFVTEAIDLRERLAVELRRIEADDRGDPLWLGVRVSNLRVRGEHPVRHRGAPNNSVHKSSVEPVRGRNGHQI